MNFGVRPESGYAFGSRLGKKSHFLSVFDELCRRLYCVDIGIRSSKGVSMKQALLFCAALFFLSTPASAQLDWQSGGNQASPSISVNAEGIVWAAPDVFFLEVSVTMQDLDLEKIQADVAKKCGEVVKAAKEFKLDPARTFTRDYSIAPIRDNTQRLISYRVSQQFRFALADLKQAEALTIAVLRAGVTSVDSIQFSVSETEELWEQAREKAVEKAVSRAGRMAKAAGATLGSATSISDQGSQVLNLGCSWSPSDQTATGSDGAALPEGDHVFFVPPTAVKFQVNVQARFALEPKQR